MIDVDRAIHITSISIGLPTLSSHPQFYHQTDLDTDPFIIFQSPILRYLVLINVFLFVRSLHACSFLSFSMDLTLDLIIILDSVRYLCLTKSNKASESNYKCEMRIYNKSNEKITPCPRRCHPVIVGVCASDFCCDFGTTPLCATASKNRSTTAFPCLRFDSEMCSFGRCA